MKILIVKLTSMGDVLHVMPALTDLRKHLPDATIDWMVEDSFSDIPTWHPAVSHVYKVSTRRWRKFDKQSRHEFSSFKKTLQAQRYDIVVDAQGLIKSALIARLARLSKSGIRAGFSGDSMKESPAAWAYHKTVKVDRKQHAVSRLRQLFAGVFNYDVPNESTLDYGINLPQSSVDNSATILLFHGTTWATKHLPEQIWRDLAQIITAAGYKVKVCWGNEVEHRRANWIAQDKPMVEVLDKSSLTTLAQELSSARGAIAVDTGLGHLAAGLSIPTVSIYGATDSALTGAVGQNQLHLQSDYHCSPCLLKTCDKLDSETTKPPCYETFSAIKIWQSLQQQLL